MRCQATASSTRQRCRNSAGPSGFCHCHVGGSASYGGGYGIIPGYGGGYDILTAMIVAEQQAEATRRRREEEQWAIVQAQEEERRRRQEAIVRAEQQRLADLAYRQKQAQHEAERRSGGCGALLPLSAAVTTLR